MRLWTAVALGLALTGPAIAAPFEPGMAGVPTLIDASGKASGHQTSWVRAPAQAQISAVKPKGVSSSGIAVMRCKIKPGGALGPCKAQGYAPTKAFGQAGLTLMPSYAIDPSDALLARSENLEVVFVIGWSGDSGCYLPYCWVHPSPAPR